MIHDLKIKPRTNLNSLNLEEKKALAKKTYAENSYFQSLFDSDQAEFDCEHVSLALRNEIQRLLLEKGLIPQSIPLESLHEHFDNELKAYNFNDGVNKISTYFYDTDDKFIRAYHQLIRLIRKNIVTEPFWFQATPTIRIHCPNGENSHHYPRYHTDISYGHPAEEINIWLPLTSVLDGHSFRTMSVENSKKIIEQFDYDYGKFIDSAIHNKDFSNYCDSLSRPVQTDFGKLYAFDSRCVHTGEPLKTHTRVSIDIRILPLSQYLNMEIEYQGSGRRKILFVPGHCYDERDSEYFLNETGI